MTVISKADVYNIKGLLLLILASLDKVDAVQWLPIVLHVVAAACFVMSFVFSLEE